MVNDSKGYLYNFCLWFAIASDYCHIFITETLSPPLSSSLPYPPADCAAYDESREDSITKMIASQDEGSKIAL